MWARGPFLITVIVTPECQGTREGIINLSLGPDGAVRPPRRQDVVTSGLKTRIGGDFDTYVAAYQFTWLD